MTYSSNDLLGNSSFHGGGGLSSSSSHNYRSNSTGNRHHVILPIVLHRGSLCRIDVSQGSETLYTLEILLESATNGRIGVESHELIFLRKEFDFALRLFSIIDSESRGQVGKSAVQEFVTIRCPVFWRRDQDLSDQCSMGNESSETSPTFEEVWMAVAHCCVSARTLDPDTVALAEIGVEGWMVFCRFIALAQYLEAKRRFSGRHLQQTMRHRNSPRGSEMVVVDVPPAAPPVRLTAKELALYEKENQKCLPLPELDLDHSLLAAHDVLRLRRKQSDGNYGHVKIDIFGPPSMLITSSNTQETLEFCLTYCRGSFASDSVSDSATVRRSMSDMKWLNDTFVSQKTISGTLCGRILPPFPGNRVLIAQTETTSLGSATGGAIAAAANAGAGIANVGVGIASAGVGILKEGIKSLWGGYLGTTPQLAAYSKPEKPATTKCSSHQKNIVQTFYNPHSPAGITRHLERYLNYLLEHPALSTSFPLNTILKASQSGLEAAKHSLEEHTKAAKAIKERTPNLDDGKSTSFWSMNGSGSANPDLGWVRTAAQAAVALQLHGVLETTGLPSASARLQHASLPTFNNSRSPAWVDYDGDHISRKDSDDAQENGPEESFEEGVMHVEDGLDQSDDPFASEDDGNGYDLLPLPVPAPERQVLTVGEAKANTESKKEARFRYGASPLEDGVVFKNLDDDKRVYLGEMSIDENIDKLRDVIGQVDNTLSRCLSSGGGIERARRECLSLHLSILRGLDSWEGLRGKFVAQRALLKGVSGIEQSREVFEESDLALIDDISWQTALAHSAVSAAEDVRSAVRAARTAANAKAAAVSAANVAQTACQKGKFHSVDEARAAQTRASIAQGHAIHAAVVEHEAKTVKRRATLALAHDVKCWNIHRKREILQVALSYAKSQHEATRRAVDAWSCLRDGFVGSNIIPSTQAKRVPLSQRPRISKIDVLSEEPEVQATIYGPNHSPEERAEKSPIIVAVEHELLKIHDESSETAGGSADAEVAHTDHAVPVVVADPVPEGSWAVGSDSNLDPFGFGSSMAHPQAFVLTSSGSANGCAVMANSAASATGGSLPTAANRSIDNDNGNSDNDRGDEAMTSSMQSLVNGLMTWGGEDVEVDFTLPAGMAASIALEESGIFGSMCAKMV